MNENLITEIIDLNKVKANLLELQKMWEQLITTMAAKSSKDLKFENLAQNLKTVMTAEAELAKTKQASFEIDKKKVKITAEIIANYDKYDKEQQKIIEQEIKRRAEIAETNKRLKEQFTTEQDLIKVLQRETKSIADLDKQNRDLQRIQQKLNLTTKEGQEANAKINSQIEKNRNTIKEYTNVIDKQRRNVGNYQEAVDTANMSLGEMRKELLALRNMSFAGLSPEEIKQIKDRMAELTDEIGDFQAQIKVASADRIPALMSGLQGLIAVAQGVTGTLAMFGIETEKLDKAMVQLIGVSQALKTAQELQERGTIKVMLATIKDTAAKTANAVAAKGQAMATDGATKAIRALGRVMASNPYAAIAAAAAAAVTAIVLLVKYMKAQTSEMQLQYKMYEEMANIKGGYLANLEIEKQSMNSLFEQIKKTNAGSEERKKLVDELNRNYKDYLPNLDLEKATLEELVIAQKESNVELQNKIAIQAQDKAMAEIFEKMKDLKIKEMEATQKLARAEKNRDDAMKAGSQNQLSYIQLYNKAKRELDAITFSLQAYEKQLVNIQTYFRNQIALANQLTEEEKKAREEAEKAREEAEKAREEAEKAREEEKKAAEAAKKRYQDYLDAIKKANEEAKLSIELGENRLEVRKRELEAIYAATKAYYELNGYTADEIKKLKELRAEIEKLNVEIANTPKKLLKKQEVKTLESAAEATGEILMNMRDVTPTLNESAAGLEKMDLITAKLRNAFNDFFGATEPIEDWRDTFKESITTVLNESFNLYNQIIDMQSNQLERELDAINIMYDKQVSTLDSVYEKRKSLLEATIDDEEELAEALARIEKEKLENQKKIEDEKFAKEQEIAKKRAILEKRKAEMEIAAGSATALVEALKLIGIATATAAPGDPYSLVARIAAALAAALTVVGAVTAGIARVKAIEIPEFWQGGEAEEGQLISVAERGKELAVGESGKSYLFDKKSVLVAPERMRIFSNYETNKILEKQTINNVYEKQSNVNLTVTIDNERIKKYFKLN
jgi:hypothetical protein